MQISLFDMAQRIDQSIAKAELIRQAGFARYWVPQVNAADPMVTLGVIGSKVPNIGLGTSVMAMQTTLPQTMAQQARTVNQISGGRFTLGLGVNHEPVVTNRWGLDWDKPYSRLVEYLDALIPLLTDQSVSVSGTYTTHHTEIDVPADPPSLMLAALGPRMLRLSAERTNGTITWMTGPKTIEEHIRPNLGAESSIAAGVGIVLTDDVAGARAFANKALAIYPTLPSYRAVMDREGAAEAADMMIIGSADDIREGIDRYRRAGVDELAANIFGGSSEFDATVEILAEMS